jgi:hypothetical protein
MFSKLLFMQRAVPVNTKAVLPVYPQSSATDGRKRGSYVTREYHTAKRGFLQPLQDVELAGRCPVVRFMTVVQ